MRKRRVNALVLTFFGLGIAVCASACNGNASSVAANQDGVAGAFANAGDPPSTGAASGRSGSAGTGATAHVGGTGAAGHGTGGAVAGIAGSGAHVGSGGTGAAGSSSGGASPTFTNVYAILMQSCAGGGCHLTSPGAAGLLMSNKMTAYMNLVGVGSSKCFGQQRVVAGNPDTSVLMLALEHMRTSTCRAPSMPQGSPQLSATDLGTIRAWIMAGAMND